MRDLDLARTGKSRGKWARLLAAAAIAGAGCHSQVIPNTTIEDNRDNRAVIEFCEGYRRALEQRDISALLAMASPRYYENGGTPEGADDYDIDGLRDVLATALPRLQAVRYEFRYRRVAVEKDRVLVDYTFSGSYRIEAEDGPQWFRRVADNRLELERVGGQYRILAGM